jgi:dTDP-4-dehydrorhamnose reductase/dTDP-4-dehydrorhamnose 3,5-epimerase
MNFPGNQVQWFRKPSIKGENMKLINTKLKGVLVIENDMHNDIRGWFTESYNKKELLEYGIFADFVQDNHAYSAHKGTLRGIHFQINPMAQTKLIRCTKGAIIDTIVDLRKGSNTYKQWYSIELSSENKKQLYIPKGFGHAYLTLTDDVEVQYKVDEYYAKEYDRSIKFDDPEIDIDWGIDAPVLSLKDLSAPLLKDSDVNFSIKVLVTGVYGQLGHDVVKRLNELGIQNIGVDKDGFNITNEQQVEAYMLNYKPDVVVHCAAYTAVDKAEDEKDLCYAVNTNGTMYIAKVCKKIDAKMIYISTDYVFDGQGSEAQKEDKHTAPVNYYGYTKERGEVAVKRSLEKYLIIRTSWVYGKSGNNFVKTMLKLGQSKDEISVVDDQIGAPTYSRDLAVLICDMLQTSKYGVYHGVNEGYCSWHRFAVEIFKQAGINIKVKAIPTAEYPARANRPLNSRLSKEMLDNNGFDRLPEWKDALIRYLQELNEEG